MAFETLQKFFHNLRELPRSFRESLIRHDRPTSDRMRSLAVFSSFFLPIHSTGVHRYSLKSAFTRGLGVAATSSFFILCVSGIVLMIYYKPSVEHAYSSILDIQYAVPSGRLVRNIHPF